MLSYEEYKDTLTDVISTVFNDHLNYELDGIDTSINHMLTNWANNKEWFYKLFGDKYIVSSDSVDVEAKLFDVLDFRNQFLNGAAHYMNRDEYCEFSSFVTSFVVGAEGFKNNSIIYNTSIKKNTDNIPITHGTKLSKTFRHFARDEKNLAAMQVLYSTYAQKMKSKKQGKIYLSIHPYDFLTTSDNDRGWSSCHSLYEGDYRTGNLNYLADGVTLVAYYLTDDDEWNTNPYNGWVKDFRWNNKVWRMLIHLKQEDDKILVIYNKEYPYVSQQFLEIVDGMIRDLFAGYDTEFINDNQEDLGFLYSFTYNSYYSGYRDLSGYNSNNSRFRYSKKLLDADNKIPRKFITIGEPVPCLCCGSEYATENHLAICDYCNNAYNSCCDECGCSEHREDLIYVESEDIFVCRYCCDKYFSMCECCEEYFRTDEMCETTDGLACVACVERDYTICEICGIAIPAGEEIESNEHIYCDNCVKENL